MMFDTSEDGIKKLISEGESTTVEFKQRLPPGSILARTLVAFANTNGGIILIGISDNGEIIGLTKKEATVTMTRIQRISSNLLNANINSSITNIDGRIVVYAIINKVPETLYPIRTSTGDLYNRVGRLTKKSTEEEVDPTLITGPPVNGFVAMSFRVEEEPALVDYFEAMKRAVREAQVPINLMRIDLLEGDYEISQKIMDKISESDFVLADFTLNPSNVYFEVGNARGSGKIVIQTARLGTLLEFDTRNWRTIFYKNATELEKELIPALVNTYKEVLKRKG
ncbi:MAG TPA: ATP-binding protein [Desulfobacteria bacterium]|nr:ATP-binding protein [Desulfobacteria bacterium]